MNISSSSTAQIDDNLLNKFRITIITKDLSRLKQIIYFDNTISIEQKKYLLAEANIRISPNDRHETALYNSSAYGPPKTNFTVKLLEAIREFCGEEEMAKQLQQSSNALFSGILTSASFIANNNKNENKIKNSNNKIAAKSTTQTKNDNNNNNHFSTTDVEVEEEEEEKEEAGSTLMILLALMDKLGVFWSHMRNSTLQPSDFAEQNAASVKIFFLAQSYNLTGLNLMFLLLPPDGTSARKRSAAIAEKDFFVSPPEDSSSSEQKKK